MPLPQNSKTFHPSFSARIKPQTPEDSIMPFPGPRHQQSLSDPSVPHDNFYGAANAIYSTGQTLTSAGQFPAQLNHFNNQFNTAPDNRVFQQTNTDANGSVIPYRSAPGAYSAQGPPPQDLLVPSLRRTLTSGRQTEELHLPQAGTAMSDIHQYGAPPAYSGDNVSTQYQPSTPQHPSSAASNLLPGTLQPGQQTRPMPLGSNNAAPSLPTLPQISTQMQQTPMNSRSGGMNHSHNYSRSSPGLVDQQKYKPFSNTPEQTRFTTSTGGYLGQPPQGPPSYSPLGLADIRQRTDANFPDLPLSPGTAQENDVLQYPTNSSYLSQWPIYAVDWCKWPPRSGGVGTGKIAIGSFLEDNHNYIQILDAQKSQIDPDDPDAERGYDFIKTAEATHAYPVTRVLWEPSSSMKQTNDLLATSGDHLRLWSLPSDPYSLQNNTITRSGNPKDPPLQKLSPLALLSNSKSPEHTAPITSLDWNVMQPSLIITSSIDTTCTIWDIPTLTAKTQLIAHDKEVFDVRFCAGSVDVFVSCGADGSVRMFDLRSLEHSTIIYEPSEKQDKSSQLSSEALSASPTRGGSSQNPAFPPPLLRIAASPHDTHLLATFSQDSSIIRVLDVRQPGQALLELKGHGASVNCIEWCNTKRGMLASGADDCCVLLWDLLGSSATGGNVASSVPGQVGQERGPSASWDCGFEISNLSWAPVAGTLGVCGGRGFWGVQL